MLFEFVKKIFCFILVAVVFLCPVLAHPGRTDSKGGHYDRQSGVYHYHHGYPAHQHKNGVCPYEYDDKTVQSSGGLSTYTNTYVPKSVSTANKSDGGDTKMSTGAIFCVVIVVLFAIWIGLCIHDQKSNSISCNKVFDNERQRLSSEKLRLYPWRYGVYNTSIRGAGMKNRKIEDNAPEGALLPVEEIYRSSWGYKLGKAALVFAFARGIFAVIRSVIIAEMATTPSSILVKEALFLFVSGILCISCYAYFMFSGKHSVKRKLISTICYPVIEIVNYLYCVALYDDNKIYLNTGENYYWDDRDAIACAIIFVFLMCVDLICYNRAERCGEKEHKKEIKSITEHSNCESCECEKLLEKYKATEAPWKESISEYPRFEASAWAYMTDENRDKLVDDYINRVRAYAYSDIRKRFVDGNDKTTGLDQEEIARLSKELLETKQEVKKLKEKLESSKEQMRKHKQEMAQMQQIQFVQKYGIDSADTDPVPHKYCPVCCLRNADDAEVCRECEHDFRNDAVPVRALPPASSFMHWLDDRYDTSYQRLRRKNAKRIRISRYDPVTQRAFVQSEKGEDEYIATYRYCTCWDFRTRELPCKHMYAVMMNLGILPPE